MDNIDAYLKELKSKQLEWAQTLPISERIELFRQVLANLGVYKDEWAAHDLKARQVMEGHWDEGSSYLAGPGITARLLRTFIQSLESIEKYGVPKCQGKQVGNRVVVEVYPSTIKERLLGLVARAEIHLNPGSKVEDLEKYQAKFYKDKSYEGGVSLILAAGNVAYLTASDLLHKLVVQKRVVIVKVHPILSYLHDILGKIFKPLVERGYVKFVLGGSVEGNYLAHHPLVDDIHMTGSDKTFAKIVNSGVNKPVTGELGNVTPVIVVPGNWKEEDFEYQADSIVTRLGTLNGYACCALRVLILPKNWEGSQKLLHKISEKMSALQQPSTYYPGTDAIMKEVSALYPNMECHGAWAFAKDLDPGKPEPAFQREFWMTFMAQTSIDAPSKEVYLQKAVAFANTKLWGTLSVNIIIDSESKKEVALQKAIDDLHYGSVGINQDAIYSSIIGKTTWGGYLADKHSGIQSGNCYVGNALMFDNIEKSVVYDHFKKFPRPFVFLTSKARLKGSKALVNFLISNSWKDFFKLVWNSI